MDDLSRIHKVSYRFSYAESYFEQDKQKEWLPLTYLMVLSTYNIAFIISFKSSILSVSYTIRLQRLRRCCLMQYNHVLHKVIESCQFKFTSSFRSKVFDFFFLIWLSTLFLCFRNMYKASSLD